MEKRLEFLCKRIGEEIQIKVTLTAAKENVQPGDDNVLPGAAAKKEDNEINFTESEKVIVTPTEQEKQNVADLLKSLGL